MRSNFSKLEVDLLDLTKVTRNSKKVRTVISVGQGYDHPVPWIKCGEIDFWRQDRRDREVWMLKAYLEGITDCEHDSSQIFRMNLIGVRLFNIGYGGTHVTAFIDPDPQNEDFLIPEPGFDPFKGATQCTYKECKKDPHLIGDFYVPKHNAKLFERLRGLPIEINTGFNHKEE